MTLDNGGSEPDAGRVPRARQKKRARGPTLPIVYVSEEQNEAIRDGVGEIDENYGKVVRAVLLTTVGRIDLVPEMERPWVAKLFRDAADELDDLEE